jgi:hypothetical protein
MDGKHELLLPDIRYGNLKKRQTGVRSLVILGDTSNYLYLHLCR